MNVKSKAWFDAMNTVLQTTSQQICQNTFCLTFHTVCEHWLQHINRAFLLFCSKESPKRIQQNDESNFKQEKYPPRPQLVSKICEKQKDFLVSDWESNGILLANTIDVNGSQPNYITHIDNVLVQKWKEGKEVKINENASLCLSIERTKSKIMKYMKWISFFQWRIELMKSMLFLLLLSFQWSISSCVWHCRHLGLFVLLRLESDQPLYSILW